MRIPRLRALVFDFDGTLARPALDFPLMKRRLAGLAGDVLGVDALPGALPALEWIEQLAGVATPEQADNFRDQAHALIRDMEQEAAARTSLFPFTRPLLDALRARGVRAAVITRNCRQAVDQVFPDAAEHLDAVLTREDVARVKPDPEHLLAALAATGADPGEAMMVGDHPLDVLTARRAGTWAGAVASGDTDREALRQAGPDLLADDAQALHLALTGQGWY